MNSFRGYRYNSKTGLYRQASYLDTTKRDRSAGGGWTAVIAAVVFVAVILGAIYISELIH